MSMFEFKLVGFCKDKDGKIMEFTEDQVKSIVWVNKK